MSRLSYTLSSDEKRTFYGTAKLPDEFIKHLRTLFEHLDDKNEGLIKISDLEAYWGNEYHLDESMSNSLIIQRLHEFASTKNGLISFPRFCAGVKDALLDVKVRKRRPKSFINALDLSGLDLNSSEEPSYVNSNESNKKIQVRRSATVRERGRVERNERRRKQEFAQMEQRSLEAYYDPNFQREELQSVLDKGMQMVDKIKIWYTRKHSLVSKNTTIKKSNDTFFRERKKIENLNRNLEEIIASQSHKKDSMKDVWSNGRESEIIIEQQEKIAQLESEKALLIRELFQLKAQLKSPAAKRSFALFS